MRLPVPSRRSDGSGKDAPWKKPIAAWAVKAFDVSEGGIADAGGRHLVVQGVAHVVAEPAHPLEPGLDHHPHRIGEVEPGADRGIAADGAEQKEEGVRVGQG
jgi:hypothetical protein